MVAILGYAAPLVIGFLPEILIGLALLLILLASVYMLRKPLVAILTGIPLIGGAAANAVNGALDWFLGVVGSWVEWAATPIIHLIMTPISSMVGFGSVIVGGFEYVMDQLKLVTLAAAGQIGRLATALAGVNLGNLIRYVLLPTGLAAVYVKAQTFTAARVRSEADIRYTQIQATQARIATLTQAEAAARLAGDYRAAAQLGLAVTALQTALVLERGRAITYTDQRVGHLQDELTQVTQKAIPAALAAALAATALVATKLLRLQRECVDPVCNAFGGSTSIWSSLQTGLELGIMLELVGQAVRDPQGAAHVVAAGADGIHNLGASLLQPIIGYA
jgi:hypothetical protein